MNRLLRLKPLIQVKSQYTPSWANYATQRVLVKHSHPTSPLTAFHQRLDRQLRSAKDPRRALENVLKIVKEIKTEHRLDRQTYQSLLLAYSQTKDIENVLKYLEEMRQSGFSPTLDQYNGILEVLGRKGQWKSQETIREEMKKDQVKMNASSYQHLIQGAPPEERFRLLKECRDAGLEPTLRTLSTLIETSDSRTAFRLLKSSGLASQASLYLDVLRASAADDDLEQVRYCWSRLEMKLDEGTLLEVLRVGSRHRDLGLIQEALKELKRAGYRLGEHHLAPLMEARDLKGAFEVLSTMRESGLKPTLRTAQVWWGIEPDEGFEVLEELRADGKVVDVVAFNLVLKACADRRDLERTLAVYREASLLAVSPDLESFHTVLDVCIDHRMKGLGTNIYEDMKKALVLPTLETYTRMIALCCTQKNYEDAFKYLEDMKKSFGPSRAGYRQLAKKLAFEKDPRFHMVLEEMESLGYRISPDIRALWTVNRKNHEI